MRAFRFLAALAANRLGGVPKPSWCTYLVTLRCNARCRMCDSWRLPRTREMSPDDVHRVFAALGRLDVVRLSGGEPFLRDDFSAVARAIEEASRPLVLHITTNGSFPEAAEEFAATFPRPRALRFLVSLDGLPEEHDANRGKAVRFAKAEETVKRLARLGQRLRFPVNVNHTVISERSLGDAAALQARFTALGVEVTTVLAYAESATYTLGGGALRNSPPHPSPGYPLHPHLAQADVATLIQNEIQRARRLQDYLLRIGKTYYLRGLLPRLEGHPAPAPRPPCVALRSHLRLLPDGSVPVCQFNGTSIGNATISSPRNLWRSPAAQAGRRWVDACPGCWAECEVVPNAIYTGDILAFLVRSAFAPSSHRLGNLHG